MKEFAAEPQKEDTRDEYTLDEVSFRRLFRQIFTLAERYKDVPSDADPKYWEDAVKDISTLSNDWKLRDAEGRVIIDPSTDSCKYHPLFFNMASAILDSYGAIWKARNQ